jgi:hypothetical protein
MEQEYIKPVTDKQREAMQAALLQSMGMGGGEQVNENAKPKFAAKNVKAETVVADVRTIMQKHGIDLNRQDIVAILATFYQNLSRVLK